MSTQPQMARFHFPARIKGCGAPCGAAEFREHVEFQLNTSNLPAAIIVCICVFFFIFIPQ